MCPPDVPDPKPTPKALPAPAETASGISSSGSNAKASTKPADTAKGIDALRVDLAVPETEGSPSGGFGTLLSKLF